jgi:hypothetical protein
MDGEESSEGPGKFGSALNVEVMRGPNSTLKLTLYDQQLLPLLELKSPSCSLLLIIQLW